MAWSPDELRTQVVQLQGEFENVISISAGNESESLIRFITNELDDATLDGVEVIRDLERGADFASEPITVAALIGLSSVTVLTVGRIIERWQESRRQREERMAVVTAFQISKEAGRALTKLGSRHADVAIKYQLVDPKRVPRT